MYRYNYDDSYGRRSRDRRGRYMDGGYSTRGGRNTYRGDDKLEEMLEEYLCYSDAKSEYDNTGNYGAKDDTKDSLKHMLKSAEDFFEMLMNEAGSQEEIQMIKETARKISEM